MIKYNNSNIDNWNFGDANIIKIYSNGVVAYYKWVEGSTAQTPCYAVVNDISQYTDTEFVDVYDKATSKWYKLNNLGNFEAYGVYADGTGSTVTTYEGKLAVVDGYEYQYTNGAWINVGEVSGSSRVPQGYAEVEYLETPTKSQYPYIDTLFKPNQNTRAIADFQYTQTNTHPRCFGCGTYNSMGYMLNAENGITSNGVWNWKFGQTSAWLTSGVHTDFNRHTAEISNGKLYLDNVQIASTTVTAFQMTDNIGLFGFIQNGTLGGTGSGEYMTGRFYSFKIYDNGTLVRDFVPCKNSSNVYGMYDIVGDSFYRSPNSYLFTGGSETSQIVYPIYYDEKQDPPTTLTFNTMEEALAYQCPYVGVIAIIGGRMYKFNANYEWEELSYTITGVTTSSSDFTIKLNNVNTTCTVFSDNGDGTYNWGVMYTQPITNTTQMCTSNTALKQFDWGDADLSNLTTLGSYTFSGCSNLVTHYSELIPSGITAIGSYAFERCGALTSVDGSMLELPSGLTSIGSYAFYYNFNQTRYKAGSIKIPRSLTSIGNEAFSYCYYLYYTYLEDLSSWFKVNISNPGSCPWYYAYTKGIRLNGSTTNITNITIPSDVTTLKSYTFANYTTLTGLTIPSTVTAIDGEYTFYNTSIRELTVPSSVTNWYRQYVFANNTSLSSVTLNNSSDIPQNSFRGCTNLREATINLSGSNRAILGYSFARCTSLSSVTMNSAVGYIYGYSFSGCSNLNSVTIESTTPPTLYDLNAFSGTSSDLKFYVPCSAVNTYRTANKWSNYASQIVGFESCTTYDWQVVSGEYVCANGNKYAKEQKIRSFDGGETWEAVTPAEYRQGSLIEEGSVDCQKKTYDNGNYYALTDFEVPKTNPAPSLQIPWELSLVGKTELCTTPISVMTQSYYSMPISIDSTKDYEVFWLDSGWGATTRRQIYNYGGYKVDARYSPWVANYPLYDGVRNTVTMYFTDSTNWSNGITVEVAGEGYSTVTATSTTLDTSSYSPSYGIKQLYFCSQSSYRPNMKFHYFKETNVNTNELMYNYVPVERVSDGTIGLWDTVHEIFTAIPFSVTKGDYILGQ